MLRLTRPENWRSEHGTVTLSRPVVAVVDNAHPSTGVHTWQNGHASLVELVRRAEAERVSLTSVGSAWSLSDAIRPRAGGWLVATKALSIVATVGLRAQWSGHPRRDRLVFCQSGVEISRLHEILAANALSLPTTGASCGQSVAGAVFTGTHGSALQVGGLPSCVRGLHLVVSGGRSVWVEPEDGPCVTADWCAHVGAELVKDTKIFEAALVSAGGFGVCHGLLLEAEPLFLLKRHRYRRPLQEVLDDVSVVDDTIRIADRALPGGVQDLYHFDIVVNPNEPDRDVIVQAMVRAGLVTAYAYDSHPPPMLAVSSDVLEFAGRLLDRFGGVPLVGSAAVGPRIRRQVRELEELRYPETGNRPEVGVLGECFPRTAFTRGGASLEVGVDARRTKDAVNVVLEAVRAHARPAYPGLVGVRFVPRSRATLAFTRYAPTCTIETPMVATEAAGALFGGIMDALRTAAIPFTLHWGQAQDWQRAPLTRLHSPAAIRRWKEARLALLGPEGRETFANQLLFDADLT